MTGMLQDDMEPTALMHKYGGLVFWDYSVAGPTTVVDMNPQVTRLLSMITFVISRTNWGMSIIGRT